MSTKNTPEIDLQGHPKIVLDDVTVSASGSAVFSGYGYGDIYLLVNVKGPVNGTPSLIFTLTPVDPRDGLTPIGGISKMGPVIVGVGGSYVRLSTTESDTILVSWMFTGPGSFEHVNATLVGKSAGTRNEAVVVPGIPQGTRQATVLGYFIPPSGALWRPVRELPYFEPAAGGQFSIRSEGINAANDTAFPAPGGTGARKVRITYYDSTLANRFFEDVALNGNTWVNTVATNLRFIEKMEVIEVGSAGYNQGGQGIVLNDAPGGGGNEVGRIAGPVNTVDPSNLGANQTNWVHHYVQSGVQSFLIFLTAGVRGTNSPSEFAVFVRNPLALDSLGSPNSPELQAVPTIRVEQNANSVLVSLAVPVPVLGPAIVTMFGRQDGGGGNQMYAGFSYSEATP